MEIWRNLLEKVKKPLKESDGTKGISWGEVAQLYGIARGFTENVDRQSFERTGSAIDHLFETKEYGSMPQNLSTMQALIPEIHPVRIGEKLTSVEIWRNLLEKVKKPLKESDGTKGISWGEVAQLYGIAWGLTEIVDRQSFERTGGAIDHLFETKEYGLMPRNLSTIKTLIPQGANSNTGEEIWEGLLRTVEKPKEGISWN